MSRARSVAASLVEDRGPSRPARRRDHAGSTGSIRGAQALEPRVLLSTFIVSNTNDGGAGSLRQAITQRQRPAQRRLPGRDPFRHRRQRSAYDQPDLGPAAD